MSPPRAQASLPSPPCGAVVAMQHHVDHRGSNKGKRALRTVTLGVRRLVVVVVVVLVVVLVVVVVVVVALERCLQTECVYPQIVENDCAMQRRRPQPRATTEHTFPFCVRTERITSGSGSTSTRKCWENRPKARCTDA